MASRILLLLFFSLLLVSVAAAQVPDRDDYSTVLVNSEDWQDVYSAEIFSNLIGKNVRFLVSTRHAQLIQYELSRPPATTLILSSDDLPFAVGYQGMLESEGFDVIERSFDRGEMNLELARALPDINKYIVIDPSYGYNAISVAPYAVRGEYYVLLADANNIDDIVDFLSGREPEEILLYGSLSRDVITALTPFDTETINYEGDRYRNNIELVSRYLEMNPTRQVILSNGEFIEAELMTGSQAVLFIGTGNVPEVVKEFIREKGIEVGVLIGNQYVGTATNIRRQTGMSVFVKFARGARNPSGPIAQVEGLDMFYLPSYNPSISVYSITYNQISGRLEVTIKNEGPYSTYLRGTYTLSYGDNERQRIGDVDPVFLDANKYKTLTYEIGQLTGDIVADAFILFGESPSSLDFLLEQNGIIVETTSILDNAEIEIVDVYYDAVRERFVVELINPGETTTYADVEIYDLVVAGDEILVAGEEVIRLEPGEEGSVLLPVQLEEEDYLDNDMINLRVFYGQREEYMVKTLLASFELAVKAVDYLLIGLVGLAVVILLLFLLLFFRRRKKKEREERYSSRWRGSSVRRKK